MRIAVGTDHRGFPIRSKVIELVKKLGHEVVDVGTFSPEAVDYPDVAADVAHRVSRGEVDRGILVCGTGLGMCIAASVAGRVSRGEADRGILVCGTGLGMCIAANKFPGVRAAPCHDDLTAEMSRRHNDSNVLCLSADLLGERLIGRMIELWLTTPFEGGRHARRIEKITAIEREIERQGPPAQQP